MYIAPELKERWKRFTNEAHKGLMEHFSMEITSIEQGLLKATMPIAEPVLQPFGYLHGGASAALAETLASLGSWMLLESEQQVASGLEVNATHLRPVREGLVHAEAKLEHKGRRLHVWTIQLSDERQRLISTARCSVIIVEPGPTS
jgi:1,4-dihydroxy-2-naphthoyl-CoA hydrolase